jgi:predicted lipoprotein with Yx(FWY)xxD motif
VDVRQTSLGQILVDGRGMTLYLFGADTTSASACYGDCAQNWPPLHTKGAPVGGGGTMQGLLATTMRKDGTAQVTYNGHPLYFFGGDSMPGDTHGEGLNAFGGHWNVVSPSGTKI